MILLISIKNSILFLFIKIGDADINDRPKIAFQEKPCSEEYDFFLTISHVYVIIQTNVRIFGKEKWEKIVAERGMKR